MKTGRGNTLPAVTATRILLDLCAGESIEKVAPRYDVSSRTVYRYAKTHPSFRAALNTAIQQRPRPTLVHGAA